MVLRMSFHLSVRLSVHGTGVLLFLGAVCVLLQGSTGRVQMKSNKLLSRYDMGSPRTPQHRTRRSIPLDLTDKQELLDKHNELRRLEPAADMEVMVWNDFLADMAQDWAEGCYWGHGHPPRNPATLPFDYIGQNLYFTTGTANLRDAIQAFYNETYFYDFDTNTCQPNQMCGHYTQVVWAKSRELGCAIHKCYPLRDNLNREFYGASYLVCNYGPGGNYVGEWPFQVGPRCTKCTSGAFWCDNGLCNSACTTGGQGCACRASCQNGGCATGSCTCSCAGGWTGVDCSVRCDNYHHYCGANPGWPLSWCNDPDTPYVRENCPAFCGLCETAPSSPTGCDQSITASSLASPPPPPAPTASAAAAATTTTRPDPCRLITCLNGGTAQAQGTSCACLCTSGWQGDRCQNAVAERTIQGLFRFLVPISSWPETWEALRPQIANAFNQYCYLNTMTCCGVSGVNSWEIPINAKFLDESSLSVDDGYPVGSTYNGQPITEVLVNARGTPGNALCQTARELANQRSKRSITEDMFILSQDGMDTAEGDHESNMNMVAKNIFNGSLLSIKWTPEAERNEIEAQKPTACGVVSGMVHPLAVEVAFFCGICLVGLLGFLLGSRSYRRLKLLEDKEISS